MTDLEPTDEEVRAAGRVLARAVDALPAHPIVLIEFGEAMTEKYAFLRLDYVQQYGMLARD